MVTLQSEAAARVRIDKVLEASGWDLTDPKQVVFGSRDNLQPRPKYACQLLETAVGSIAERSYGTSY